jgi:tetratricopeptide (TPR) repeat protein
VKRNASRAFAGAAILLTASQFGPGASADPRQDALKCQSTQKIPSGERIASCTAALDAGATAGSYYVSRAHYLRGRAYFDEGSFDAAIADFSKVIQLFPSSTDAYSARGTAYFRRRDYDLAITDYTHVIELNPTGSFVPVYYAHVYRAEAYAAKNDVDQSISDATRAIEINPKLKLAYNVRGYAYAQKGYIELAIADYNQAIQLDPEDKLTYCGRAAVYEQKGDFGLAIADYNQAIRLDPQFKAAYGGRAVVYRLKGDLDLAIADYNQAIQLDPQFKVAYGGRATTYRLKGDLDLAIADYDELIRLDPQSGVGYYFRGLTYWHSGSFAKSLTDFDEAARLDPKGHYLALWREIVSKRTDQPSQLAEAATHLDMTKWPAPIVNLFLGALTPEQVMGAADDSNPKKRKGQVCEANFFTAELALQRGSREDARRLLELAAADCPKTFVESSAAITELRALEAKH